MASNTEYKKFIRKTSKDINLDLMPKHIRNQFDTLNNVQKAEFLGFNDSANQRGDVPFFLPESNEEVYSNGNSFIVLGTDRPKGYGSGFGGRQSDHCAAIDIVVGRKGAFGRSHDDDGNANFTPPDFYYDAARIYVSQKADPDGYFMLKPGSSPNTTMNDPRSTIALKADTLRFVARENIKIVTGTDNINAQGAPLDDSLKLYGIDLIAMNDPTDLQPLVKGKNLVKCLDMMAECISMVVELFNNFVQIDGDVKKKLNAHGHYSPYMGAKTSPDFDGLMPECTDALINTLTDVESQFTQARMAIASVRTDYLLTMAGCEAEDDEEDSKSMNILSSYNNTN